MMLRPQCPDARHPALAWVTRSLVAALRTVKNAQRGFPVLRGGAACAIGRGGCRLMKLAEWTGLEPATPGVTGRYSNQLNYHSQRTWCRHDRFAIPVSVRTGLPAYRLRLRIDSTASLVTIATSDGHRSGPAADPIY